MPKIQLIRRDSTVVELDATEVAISIQRMVAVHPLPILATRAALDLNQTTIIIKVSGILYDDETAIGGAGAMMSMDLSVGMGSAGGASWYASTGVANPTTALRAECDGKEIVFRSAGQISAGLGENITIRLKNGAGASTVATESIIVVDVSGRSTTQGIATAIAAVIPSANVHVNGVSTAFSTIFTTTAKAGQSSGISYQHQVGSAGTYPAEVIEIVNVVEGEGGNSVVSLQSDSTSGGGGQQWNSPFMVTDFTGGAADQKMTKGDKVQDLLNMVSNASVGGALISPQVLSGSLIDLPDSIASIDSAQFLRIGEQKAVQKYVVGVRIPYESLITSTTGSRMLRQFLIPAGPGTDHSAESNTESFDPIEISDGKIIRPNPFLRQGVAIPAIITTFDPIYEAGDGVWTYDISLAAVEQLVGF